jgi:hypothetical protein
MRNWGSRSASARTIRLAIAEDFTTLLRGIVFVRQAALGAGLDLSPPSHDHADQERDRQGLQRRLSCDAGKPIQWHAGLLCRIYRLANALACRSEGLRGLVGDRSDRFAGRTGTRVHRV